MSMETKARVIWDLVQNIEALKDDENVDGEQQQAYNLCLITQDLCLRLITEIDLYKTKELTQIGSHHYLTEEANWQHIPRVYASGFVNEYGDEVDGALFKMREDPDEEIT